MTYTKAHRATLSVLVKSMQEAVKNHESIYDIPDQRPLECVMIRTVPQIGPWKGGC